MGAWESSISISSVNNRAGRPPFVEGEWYSELRWHLWVKTGFSLLYILFSFGMTNALVALD
jgi:hypothetical protein